MEEDKKIEQVENDESLDEVEEEIDEAEEEVEKDEPQKKQSRNANRKFAELRKENERLEKRVAELEEYNKRAKLDTSKRFISEEAKKDYILTVIKKKMEEKYNRITDYFVLEMVN